MSIGKIVKWTVVGLFGLSLVAMAAAAATADSDQGVRSDGSRAPSDQDGVKGDPKGGAPPYDEGDDTRPDSTTHEAKQAAAGGDQAEDTAANPDSAEH
jgi:hypothetical protein